MANLQVNQAAAFLANCPMNQNDRKELPVLFESHESVYEVAQQMLGVLGFKLLAKGEPRNTKHEKFNKEYGKYQNQIQSDFPGIFNNPVKIAEVILANQDNEKSTHWTLLVDRICNLFSEVFDPSTELHLPSLMEEVDRICGAVNFVNAFNAASQSKKGSDADFVENPSIKNARLVTNALTEKIGGTQASIATALVHFERSERMKLAREAVMRMPGVQGEKDAKHAEVLESVVVPESFGQGIFGQGKPVPQPETEIEGAGDEAVLKRGLEVFEKFEHNPWDIPEDKKRDYMIYMASKIYEDMTRDGRLPTDYEAVFYKIHLERTKLGKETGELETANNKRRELTRFLGGLYEDVRDGKVSLRFFQANFDKLIKLSEHVGEMERCNFEVAMGKGIGSQSSPTGRFRDSQPSWIGFFKEAFPVMTNLFGELPRI